MNRNPRPILRFAAAAALTCGAVVGCTSTTETTTDTTSTTAASEAPPGTEVAAASAALCDAYVTVTDAFGGPPADPSALPPLLDTLDAEAPAEIADSVGVMTSAARSVLDSNGADQSAFEAPEFADAQSAVGSFLFESCELDNTFDVVGKDYAFEGIPSEFSAGLTGLRLTNEGAEVHEIVVMRKAPGVTDDWDAILALPEEQGMTMVEHVGGAFVPTPGSSSVMMAELAPGAYTAVCFVPVGTTMDHDGTGAPHFTAGMRQDFTVV